jgi:hypothetical protein
LIGQVMAGIQVMLFWPRVNCLLLGRRAGFGDGAPVSARCYGCGTSGRSMIRSQEPSGWRRRTWTRTPVLSAERVEVGAGSSNRTVGQWSFDSEPRPRVDHLLVDALDGLASGHRPGGRVGQYGPRFVRFIQFDRFRDGGSPILAALWWCVPEPARRGLRCTGQATGPGTALAGSRPRSSRDAAEREEFLVGVHAGMLDTAVSAAGRPLAVSVWYGHQPGGLLTGRRPRTAAAKDQPQESGQGS